MRILELSLHWFRRAKDLKRRLPWLPKTPVVGLLRHLEQLGAAARNKSHQVFANRCNGDQFASNRHRIRSCRNCKQVQSLQTASNVLPQATRNQRQCLGCTIGLPSVIWDLINLKIDQLGNSSLIKMNGADACSEEATLPLNNLQVGISPLARAMHGPFGKGRFRGLKGTLNLGP